MEARVELESMGAGLGAQSGGCGVCRGTGQRRPVVTGLWCFEACDGKMGLNDADVVWVWVLQSTAARLGLLV